MCVPLPPEEEKWGREREREREMLGEWRERRKEGVKGGRLSLF